MLCRKTTPLRSERWNAAHLGETPFVPGPPKGTPVTTTPDPPHLQLEAPMISTQRDVDHALAYPEPPASPLWHRDGPQTQPLTPEQQRRNRELLVLADEDAETQCT